MTTTELTRECRIITSVISDARDALEWIAEMEDLVNDLEKRSTGDVDVNTSSLNGTFIEVSISAHFDEPISKATRVMENYEWDSCGLSEDGDLWRLYLNRRVTYS